MSGSEVRERSGVVVIDFENIWKELERVLSLPAFALLTPWMVAHEIREIARRLGGIIGTSLFADFFVLHELFTKEQSVRLWEEGVDLYFCPKVPQFSGETPERRTKDTVDPTMARHLMRFTHYAPELAWIAVASHDQDFLPSVQACRDSGRTIHFILVDPDGSRAVKDAADWVHYLTFPFLERLGKATDNIASAREQAHIHALASQDTEQLMPLFRDAVLGLQQVFVSEQYQFGVGIGVLSHQLLHKHARNGLSQCSRLEVVAIVQALRRLNVLVGVQGQRARFVIAANHQLVQWANLP